MRREGTAEHMYRETKFSGTKGDRKMSIFLVQLTAIRIDNITGMIHTLLYVKDIQYILHTDCK